MFFFDAGQRRKLEQAKRLPTELAEAVAEYSANHPACFVTPTGQGVDRGGNEEGARLANRFAQQVDQIVFDALVADTSRSEKKFSKIPPGHPDEHSGAWAVLRLPLRERRGQMSSDLRRHLSLQPRSTPHRAGEIIPCDSRTSSSSRVPKPEIGKLPLHQESG